MAIPEKIDAIKGVSETFEKTKPLSPMEGANEYVERVSPNKEHFQALLNTTKPNALGPDTTFVNPSDETQDLSKNPIFSDENVSAQKSGTATDQEGKKRDQRQQNEEVEAVSATSSKKQASSTSPSLMDEVKKLNAHELNVGKISPEDLKNQAKGIIAQLDQVKAKLSEPNTEIKPSYQPLLRNRLTHIDDNLNIALSKLGEEHRTTPVASVNNTPSANPVERFIGLINNNQNQIESLMRLVGKLNEQEKIPAGMMLAIQIKVGYVQQQIELFTSLLNKALESTKTIMNVQV